MEIDKSLFADNVKPLIDLLLSDNWPAAAPKFMICEDTEKDKTERAEGILSYVGEDLTDKKFLDFGCGEGYVVREAAKQSKLAVGFDLEKTGELPWETTQDNFTLTTSIDKVKETGPYNIIMLYDVLDHAQNPEEVLKQVASLCDAETKVIVRCHPWMSRHATHIYKDLNKAFVHLIFTEDELKLMGITSKFTQKYFYPINKHKEWFDAAGFKLISNDVIRTSVEPFFKKPKIAARLPLNEYKGQFPQWQMSQSFNDYILTLK